MGTSDIQLPTNRKFGLFFVLVFGLAAIYFAWKGHSAFGGAAAIACGVLLGITLIKDSLLLPLNKAWMRLGLLLSMIVSPIVLGVIFFLVITPLAALLRLLGRDELQIRKRGEVTFWRNREGKTSVSGGFKAQF